MSAPHRFQFWKRRAAHLLLVGGLALAVVQVLDAMPREQELLFELPDGQVIRSLSATWTDTEGAQLGGLHLDYPEGRRQSVRHSVQLANGDYEIQIEVELFGATAGSGDARSKTNVERRVSLRGGETPIPLVQPNRRGIQ